MRELFGLPMNTIMLVLATLFVLSTVASAALFLSGRIMFKMGLRNLRRRPAQSTLVVSGLMLATTIITAAFTTGDTLDYSITRVAYDYLQRSDLSLHHFQSEDGGSGGAQQSYAPEELAERLGTAFATDPDIEGFIPLLFEPVPVLNTRTNLTEPLVLLAGVDPEAISSFGGLQFLGGGTADLTSLKMDEVFANERAADEMNVETGDTLQIYAQGEPVTVRVAGIVREERATGALEMGVGEMAGLSAPLATVQRITGHEGQINSISVVLRGGVRGSVARSDSAAERLEQFISVPENSRSLGLDGAGFQVEKVKQDAVDTATLASSTFTTIFLLLGLFSIASGVLLIFMIFVMLAAERQREMGITRAVGALRIHLVQAFLAEGMVYALVAGVIGVAFGVLIGFGVIVGGSRLVFGEDLDYITAHVTVRTLIVSFCLGWVMTFSTVVVSSALVSRLNIVGAIRGEVAAAHAQQRGGFRLGWLVLSVPVLLLIPPLGLFLALRKGFGVSTTWTIGPAGLAIGLGLIALGRAIDSSFVFSSGISLVPISGALLIRKWGVSDRAVWSATGVLLLSYWLLPLNLNEALFGEFNNSGMEMFVFSGIMIVAAFTLIIVYNARVVTALYAGASRGRIGYTIPAGLFVLAAVSVFAGAITGESGGGAGNLFYLFGLILLISGGFALLAQRFQSLAPALRMGIAYPLANRFRTGMTIAMFALILFSITVMSVINASFLDLFSSEEATGGWDVAVSTNRNNPVNDLTATLGQAGFDTSIIEATGGITPIDDDRQTVRQPGDEEWADFIVRAGDDQYWANVDSVLEARAPGYETDRAVYDAVRNGEHLAIIEASAVVEQDFNVGVFHAKGVSITNHRFQPFNIEIRNESTREVVTVTIIGVYSNRIPAGLFPGLTVSAKTNEELFGEPDSWDYFIRLKPGSDSVNTAETIESLLVTRGVQGVSIEKEIDDALASSRGFLRVLQLFMGLGLIVGIAAIGVISLRSVVERRQQIGMLRAIGFERATVAWSFLFESAFVALMGIGAGVIGALVLSRNLITDADFTGTAGVSMFVPWPEILTFIIVAFVFALLMTWWPSRSAAKVPVAEALRYE